MVVILVSGLWCLSHSTTWNIFCLISLSLVRTCMKSLAILMPLSAVLLVTLRVWMYSLASLKSSLLAHSAGGRVSQSGDTLTISKNCQDWGVTRSLSWVVTVNSGNFGSPNWISESLGKESNLAAMPDFSSSVTRLLKRLKRTVVGARYHKCLERVSSALLARVSSVVLNLLRFLYS